MIKILKRKNFYFLIIADFILLVLSYFLAYVVRFEGNVVPELIVIKKTIVFIVPCKLLIFYFFNLYRGMWRYTGIVDLINVIKAVAVSSLIIVAVILAYTGFKGYSRSVFIIDAVFSIFFIGGTRLLIRLVLTTVTGHLFKNNRAENKKNLLIIGAGDAAEQVVREINSNPQMKYRVVGLVDDDKSKIGRLIHGIKVHGNIDELNEIVNRNEVNEILIAMPSSPGKTMRRIVENCESTKIHYKTLPGIGELIDGKVSIKSIRDISFKDLLGRTSVLLENDKISEFIKNRTILITGAGGSIGSELCRQICKYEPALLILFDASEANL
jgi:FlaA1/EpsC-like NDP-sugar epimerase